MISLKARLMVVSAATVLFTGCCYPVCAQPKSPLFSKIEGAFRKQESAWKIEKILDGTTSTPRQEITFRNGKQQADVDVMVWPTSQEAHEIFAGQVIAFDNSHGKSLKAKLPELGDENYIWTNRGSSAWPTILFRKGDVFVSVFAPTVIVAKRFARHVLDQIEDRQ